MEDDFKFLIDNEKKLIIDTLKEKISNNQDISDDIKFLLDDGVFTKEELDEVLS